MSRESVLPITIDSTSSNGEYAPLPVGSAVTRANPALSPDVKVNVFGRSAATVYGVDPSPARRPRRSGPRLSSPGGVPGGGRAAFATYGLRNSAEWRRGHAVHGVDPGPARIAHRSP